MKKIIALTLASVLALSLVACSSETEETTTEETVAETVSITVTNGSDEKIQVEFPKDPQRVVVLNYATLDFLDAMGLGDRVVGTIGGESMPEHLKKYYEDENIVQLGGMKDYDIEAIMELQPDVIFSSDRSASAYDDFMQIAPTMAAFVTYEDGFFESYKELAQTHATIFGLEGELDTVLADYEARISAINEVANSQTAALLIFAGDSLNTLGDTGRAAIVTTNMGFTNVAADIDVNHGNEIAYDFLLELDPEYIFVLDKDTAVGEEGATPAEQQMDNEIVHQTQAYQNGTIVYLTPGADWYTNDAGITAMDNMIACIETALGIQ